MHLIVSCDLKLQFFPIMACQTDNFGSYKLAKISLQVLISGSKRFLPVKTNALDN